MITAKPRDKPQRQQASDYSTVLIWAAANQVDPDNFVEWASATTLDMCLQQVREKRAAARVQAQEAGRPAGADADTEPGVADAAPPVLGDVAAPETVGTPASILFGDAPASSVPESSTPTMAAAARLDSRVQSPPRPRIVVTLYDEDGTSRSFECGLLANACRALRTLADRQAAFTDPARMLRTLEHVVRTKHVPLLALPTLSSGAQSPQCPVK